MTTSPRNTCPLACPFRKNASGEEAGLCYAEHGHLGHYIWSGLDRTAPGHKISGRIPVYTLAQLLDTIRALPEDALWRHNQAGDLPTDDQQTIAAERLRPITQANRGRRGFTYTHHDVLNNPTNRVVVKEANDNGFTVNLSANTLEEADRLADAGCGPVTVVVPAGVMANTFTPSGRRVVICPARVREDVTCATCGICAVASRKAIIGFPALGAAKERKL